MYILCSEWNFIKLLNIIDGVKSVYYLLINGFKDFGNKLIFFIFDIGIFLKFVVGSLDYLFID